MEWDEEWDVEEGSLADEPSWYRPRRAIRPSSVAVYEESHKSLGRNEKPTELTQLQLERIRMEQERIQRELARQRRTPADSERAKRQRAAKAKQRKARRQKLVCYLARCGGEEKMRAARQAMGWSTPVFLETVAGEWFERDWQGVRLTEAGWAAAKKEAT